MSYCYWWPLPWCHSEDPYSQVFSSWKDIAEVLKSCSSLLCLCVCFMLNCLAAMVLVYDATPWNKSFHHDKRCVCVCAYIGAGGSTVCWQHLSAKRSSLAAEAKPSLHQLWSQKAGHNTSLRHWKSRCQTYSSEKRASHFPGSPRKHHLVRFLCLCNVLYSCLYSIVWSVYRVL